MKTRIIWTKIYEDSWFSALTLPEKFMFIYLFTNQRIGHTGVYELSNRTMVFETGVVEKDLIEMKSKFEKSGKMYFYQDWIFVPNASHYGGYKGTKNKSAYDRERASIPNKVINAFKEKRDNL